MKLWKLMISTIILSAVMVWACMAVDSTAQAKEQVPVISIEQHIV